MKSIYGEKGSETIAAELKAEIERLRVMYRVTEPPL